MVIDRAVFHSMMPLLVAEPRLRTPIIKRFSDRALCSFSRSLMSFNFYFDIIFMCASRSFVILSIGVSLGVKALMKPRSKSIFIFKGMSDDEEGFRQNADLHTIVNPLVAFEVVRSILRSGSSVRKVLREARVSFLTVEAAQVDLVLLTMREGNINPWTSHWAEDSQITG